MANKYTVHNNIVLAIFVPKIIKVDGNLTKLCQKQFWLFLDTVYILFSLLSHVRNMYLRRSMENMDVLSLCNQIYYIYLVYVWCRRAWQVRRLCWSSLYCQRLNAENTSSSSCLIWCKGTRCRWPAFDRSLTTSRSLHICPVFHMLQYFSRPLLTVALMAQCCVRLPVGLVTI